jgi:hypothetical protein
MNSPITNYELGKMQHREYEAEASRYWGQGTSSDNEQWSLSGKYKLVLALSGTILAVLLLVQMQVL